MENGKRELIEIIRVNQRYQDLCILHVSQLREVFGIDFLKAGKNLLRTPAVIVEFEDYKGKLLISQIMVDGRLYNDTERFFELQNDVAAVQLVLNVIKYF